MAEDDNYSKIILAIVGIVVIFALVIMLLPKQQQRVGKPFAVSGGDKWTATSTESYITLSGQCTGTSYFRWKYPEPFKCGANTITGSLTITLNPTTIPGTSIKVRCDGSCLSGAETNSCTMLQGEKQEMCVSKCPTACKRGVLKDDGCSASSDSTACSATASNTATCTCMTDAEYKKYWEEQKKKVETDGK